MKIIARITRQLNIETCAPYTLYILRVLSPIPIPWERTDSWPGVPKASWCSAVHRHCTAADISIYSCSGRHNILVVSIVLYHCMSDQFPCSWQAYFHDGHAGYPRVLPSTWPRMTVKLPAKMKITAEITVSPITETCIYHSFYPPCSFSVWV